MNLLRAALAALLFAAAPAAAEERITNFASDVVVNADSSLDVTETIDVVAENDRINHGIYRDFPTLYSSANGSRVRVGFKFEGAMRDGHDEPASVEPLANGVRMKIGDADTIVDRGPHRYVIHYRTTRQIGRFGAYDELYWNVTGNGWVFPIEQAEATIHLPSPAQFGQRAVYTGPEGSTETNAEVVVESPGQISFRTTFPLQPYEALTVAVAWPKGVIGAPDQSTKLGWWLTDYGPPFVGAFALAIILGFYFIAWHRVGRDPRAGTIVPLFTPPDGLSPAGLRYVREMGTDNRAFAAALVDMGVRGHIRITEEDAGWLSGVTRMIERQPSANPLPEEEESALEKIAAVGDVVAMKQKNWQTFSSAKKALDSVLQQKYDGTMFKRNYGWAIAGLALFAAGLWLAAASVSVATGTAGPLAFMVALGAAIAAMLFMALQNQSRGGGKCMLSLLGVLFGFGAVAVGAPMLLEALATGWWFPLLLPVLSFPIVLSAFWWISAPTIEGRKVLDHIAGFKQYLSITERQRLDRMTPPDDTPELFEKYLPYAIALGVENHWADRFAPVLAAAAAQGQQGFVWYSGTHNVWDNPSGFVGDVGSSLASSVSSASTAPGSSSGSGGGGSSGGGGGGGGGGGW